MSPMVNVALLSFWHVRAKDYARAVQNHPGARITVVWDEDEARGKAWAEQLGVPFRARLGAGGATNSPFTLEVYGTEGALVVGGPDGGVWLNSRRSGGAVSGWVRPQKLPPDDPSPMEQWIRAIETGTPPLISLQDGRDQTELMEAAARSTALDRPVDLPL